MKDNDDVFEPGALLLVSRDGVEVFFLSRKDDALGYDAGEVLDASSPVVFVRSEQSMRLPSQAKFREAQVLSRHGLVWARLSSIREP